MEDGREGIDIQNHQNTYLFLESILLSEYYY